MKTAQLHLIAIALLMIVVITGIVQAGELRTTEDQRFYVNGSWVRAADLKPGDMVETYDGKHIRITNVTDVMSDTPLQVYGFTTNNTTQSYVLADGILTSDGAGGLTSSTAPVSVWREWWARLLFWRRTVSANDGSNEKSTVAVERVSAAGVFVARARCVLTPRTAEASILRNQACRGNT